MGEKNPTFLPEKPTRHHQDFAQLREGEENLAQDMTRKFHEDYLQVYLQASLNIAERGNPTEDADIEVSNILIPRHGFAENGVYDSSPSNVSPGTTSSRKSVHVSMA